MATRRVRPGRSSELRCSFHPQTGIPGLCISTFWGSARGREKCYTHWLFAALVTTSPEGQHKQDTTPPLHMSTFFLHFAFALFGGH